MSRTHRAIDLRRVCALARCQPRRILCRANRPRIFTVSKQCSIIIMVWFVAVAGIASCDVCRHDVPPTRVITRVDPALIWSAAKPSTYERRRGLHPLVGRIALRRAKRLPAVHCPSVWMRLGLAGVSRAHDRLFNPSGRRWIAGSPRRR